MEVKAKKYRILSFNNNTRNDKNTRIIFAGQEIPKIDKYIIGKKFCNF